MISAEYGFHNENDYSSESYREMKDDETVVYENAANI